MNDAVGGTGPCVALLELASIAAGYEAVDALLKEADVRVLIAEAVTPGKFVILFTGDVEDVSSSWRRASELTADVLIDSLFIPNIEPTLLDLVGGATHDASDLDALGILETFSVASTIRAADIASKRASLRLVSLGLARGLGGKSFVTFTGAIGDVEEGVDYGATEAGELLVRRVVIPNPHEGLAGVLAP